MLRVYSYSSNNKVDKIIRWAENKSRYICEECGKRGRIRIVFGWYYTLCKKHYNELCIKRYGRTFNWFEELEMWRRMK